MSDDALLYLTFQPQLHAWLETRDLFFITVRHNFAEQFAKCVKVPIHCGFICFKLQEVEHEEKKKELKNRVTVCLAYTPPGEPLLFFPCTFILRYKYGSTLLQLI